MIVPQQPIFRLPDGTDFFSDEQVWYHPTSTTSLSASESKLFMSHPQFYGLPQSSSFANFDGAQQQQYALGPPQTPREWASYSGSDHTQFTAQQARPTPQLNTPAHRRQPSNSSLFSHASDSFAPATHMSQSYDQPRQYLSPWEAQQSPASVHRHLPTPTHTPTQDSFPAAARPQAQLARTSTINYDLPVTPRTMNGDDFNDTQFQAPTRVVPKLDRTISDIYQDELYNPSFSQPAPQQSQQQQQPQRQQHQNYNSAYLQPHQQHPNMVNERLQAANQARSASPAGVDKLRAVSPFRHGSPFAAGSAAYGQSTSHLQSAADTRRQQKAIADAMALQQHRARPNNSQPTTISPKDAVLDYKHDPDDSAVPLFPQSQPSSQQTQAPSYAPHTANHHQQQYNLPQTSFDFTQPTSHLNHDTRYGPISFQPMNSSQGSQAESQSLDFPAHLVSMETSKSEDVDEDDDADNDDDDGSYDSSIQRPARTTADTGTYTCTYHGCKERFESPARLQKHKREDHRSTGHGGPPPPSASPSAPTMTQAGPHRCDRINPQTGKPCNTIFSRPYDLTRHEDTIHNRQKTKVRCHLCTDEKTFSRSDALTRHMKVVHPTEPWPAKHKKRV